MNRLFPCCLVTQNCELQDPCWVCGEYGTSYTEEELDSVSNPYRVYYGFSSRGYRYTFDKSKGPSPFDGTTN